MNGSRIADWVWTMLWGGLLFGLGWTAASGQYVLATVIAMLCAGHLIINVPWSLSGTYERLEAEYELR